jgi:hypothetical protein
MKKEILDTGWLYEGELKDGLPHGKGIMDYPDGGQDIGEFKRLLLDGLGIKWNPKEDGGSIMVGEFERGKPHGIVMTILQDGSKYIGRGMHGELLLEEDAVRVYPDGTMSFGKLSEDGGWHERKDDISTEVGNQQSLKNGHGSIIFDDGTKFEGDFKGLQFDGEGILTSPNGETYEGEFKSGKRCGKGTQKFSDGTKYVGNWKNDLFNGVGSLKYPDGIEYFGEFEDGEKLGGGITMSGEGPVLMHI